MEEMRQETYHLWTDGSCIENKGAWAFVLLNEDKIITKGSGKCKDVDSQLIELIAILNGLTNTPKNCKVIVHSDCQEAVRRTEDIDVSRYSSIVKEISDQKLVRVVETSWCKAHADNPYNNLVDRRARKLVRRFETKRKIEWDMSALA